MTFTVKGAVVVATPGTPVPLTTDATITAQKIVVSQIPSTSGIVYLKYVHGNAAGTIARAFLPPNAAGFTDSHAIEAVDGNPLNPADWAVDAANAGQGLHVYWVTQ